MFKNYASWWLVAVILVVWFVDFVLKLFGSDDEEDDDKDENSYVD